MTAFSQPAANIAAALDVKTGKRPLRSRIAEAFGRWLTALTAARQRRAAIEVLRILCDRIPHASGAERADLVARAEALRRSLQ
jgi:hypothetical protein